MQLATNTNPLGMSPTERRLMLNADRWTAEFRGRRHSTIRSGATALLDATISAFLPAHVSAAYAEFAYEGFRDTG
ncbi:hypothetical protein PTKU46_78140 [Paraburkholderia terrae]